MSAFARTTDLKPDIAKGPKSAQKRTLSSGECGPPKSVGAARTRRGDHAILRNARRTATRDALARREVHRKAGNWRAYYCWRTSGDRRWGVHGVAGDLIFVLAVTLTARRSLPVFPS